MAAAGLQPHPEGETPDPSVRFLTRVSPERLAEFDRIVASEGVMGLMRALERERHEAENLNLFFL